MNNHVKSQISQLILILLIISLFCGFVGCSGGFNGDNDQAETFKNTIFTGNDSTEYHQ